MGIFLLEFNQINIFCAKKRISTGRYVAERKPFGVRFLTEESGTGLGAAGEQRGKQVSAEIRRSTGVNGRRRDCGNK
ncbi:hypothetical protein D3Z45_05075 [Lachnospiraceae bacterium]|nr:hypothetical protein [Lachnospiraceae bacterium]